MNRNKTNGILPKKPPTSYSINFVLLITTYDTMLALISKITATKANDTLLLYV